MLSTLSRKPNCEALAYFYCDRNQFNHRSGMSVLSSLVLQLSVFKDSGAIHPSLIRLYRYNKELGLTASGIEVEESRNLICQMLGIYLHTTIIIDGIDECDEASRSEIIEVLHGIIRKSISPVKILVSSRPEEDIEYHFWNGLKIGITSIDSKGDIAKFVTSEIQSWPAHWHHKVPSTLKDEICEMLVQNSNGL